MTGSEILAAAFAGLLALGVGLTLGWTQGFRAGWRARRIEGRKWGAP